MDTYHIRTFGCQMNKHDSERVAGMLAAQGMTAVDSAEAADVVVFMTCCVRENADTRLEGQVASLKALKTGGGRGVVIAVGGCIGQRDGEELLARLPHVDVVFGTHNLAHLPRLLEEAGASGHSKVEVLEEGSDFSSALPTRREHPWHAWLPITVGCDNFCTYCIVPYVRGRERSRAFEDVVAEAARLVAEGVREITLLGQNVNSYGRDLYGSPRFAEVLGAVAETGVDRIRFATSHPKDLSDETIEAMATIPAVMPYLHLPVQSGSDRILQAMNRSYTREQYLELVDRLYQRIPRLSLSTDIIVGFPGETDEDFEDTLEVVRRARYVQAFTFIYSPREGTPAAEMDGRVADDIVQERFDRLVELVQQSATTASSALVGTEQQVLFEGPSKRDEHVLTGRTPGNRVVHARVAEGGLTSAYAGKMARVYIDQAQTWFVSGEIREMSD